MRNYTEIKIDNKGSNIVNKNNKYIIFLVFLIIFHLLANLIWKILDNSPPGWDQSAHTITTINYFKYISSSFFNGFNIIDFLKISDYYPIFVYLLGVVIASVFGVSYKMISLTGTLFFITALISLFLYIKEKFKDVRWALISTFFFSFFISVVEASRQHMLDLPLTALILLDLYLMERFKNNKKIKYLYLFFIIFGLGQLVKWYFCVYMLVPIIFNLRIFYERKVYFKHFLFGILLTLVLSSPWYLANLSTLISHGSFAWTGERVNLPSLFSLNNLLFHFKYMIIFEISFIGIILFIISIFLLIKSRSKWRYEIILIIVFNYLFFTFIPNKNIRYVIPLMPFVAMVMGYGIERLLNFKTKFYYFFIYFCFFYYVFSYFILSFGLPFYPSYKYVFNFPVIGWVDVFYLSDYPVRYIYDEDIFPQKELVNDLIKDSQDKTSQILVDVDRLVLNSDNLRLTALMINNPRFYFKSGNNERVDGFDDKKMNEYLTQYDYVLVPKNNVIGEDKNFISYKPLNSIQNFFISGKAAGFKQVKEYKLPRTQSIIDDSDIVYLYKKR